ncbi:SCO4225 family membrane protein [Streptomyces sp. NPDC053427]|uniref:SCO4225 family membrane protein n=1 Tax=Streptomyces sp. NPDC053427 TaxID=3365701 RepID=UPI0037D109DF
MDDDHGRPDRSPQPRRPHRLRGLGRLAFGNPVSLGYLALVLAAVLFAVVDALAVHRPDASFSGIWALLLTAPTVFPLWLAGDALWGEPGAPEGYLMVATAVAALVNALLLGLLHRAAGGGRGGPRGAVVRGGWHTRRHGDH